MTWRKIYCLGVNHHTWNVEGEDGLFEDSKTDVDEAGRKVDLKRARRMFTCQSSVRGDVFKKSRKGKFFQVF